MTEEIDLKSPVGRALARSLGFVVPPEADGSAPCVALPDDSGESEKEFQARVVKLAKERGWKVYHTFDSRCSEAGFPDLILLRSTRQIVAELKVGKNKMTKEQIEWLGAFGIARAEAYLWTPSCWSDIVKTLE